MNVHAAIRQLATNTPFHWNLNFNWRLPTIEILHVTYIECTLAQTLLCEISELTNEIHQHDCRSSVLRPCQRYIVHTEADRPAENVVVATGSSSYVDHAANLYIHSDSWLLTHEHVIHSRDLKIPRDRCTGTGSVPVHVKCYMCVAIWLRYPKSERAGMVKIAYKDGGDGGKVCPFFSDIS